MLLNTYIHETGHLTVQFQEVNYHTVNKTNKIEVY
jgi:hypothetical protein